MVEGTEVNARLTASDRMARLLSVIPWVTQQDGASISEIERRFDYPRDLLLGDLQDVVFFVGVHPFSPDQLIEVDISDDKVWIRYADWFSRPLRLAPEEAAKLLTTARAALLLADDDAPDTLTRALAKLGAMLGAKADQVIDVRLGEARAEIIDVVRHAIEQRVRMSIGYHSYGRDEITEREIDPIRLFSDLGNWYLDAWCHSADAQRMFRLDRIINATLTDTATANHIAKNRASFSAAPEDPRVRLRLDSSARWVAEQYPYEAMTEAPNNGIELRLAITEIPWLERLLLRLGPAAQLVEADPPISRELAASAARRILTRYDS